MLFLLPILLSAACITASSLSGRVSWNDVCKDVHQLGHSQVVLDNGRYHAAVRRDGSFVIDEVATGSYILSVISHDFSFDSLRVDVQETGAPVVYPYIPGTPHSPPPAVVLPYPVVLQARQRNAYFVEPESFNIVGMLNNPMMLMMGVTAVLLFSMPYIMNNLDPEIAKEVKERQVKMASFQQSLQSGDLRGSLSSLLSEEPANDPPPNPNMKKQAKRRGGASRAQKS